MASTAQPVSTADSHHGHRRRIVWAGIVGNVMEWYDFAIYGFFARTIGSLYFPAEDPRTSLLAAYAVFAVGFLMRPLGAILFGHIGDRVGRGPALLWSVVAMAVPTLIMGLLPTYAQIGIWASVLMLACRMMQGLAVGGEYTSSAVFLAETAHPDKRGAATAWAVFGATGGILLGSAVGALVMNTLPLDQVVAWGWRIPFLFGVLVGVAGFLLRRRMPFDKPAAKKGSPLLQALREHPVAMLQAVAISLVNAVAFYLIFVYLISWLKLAADMGARTALWINSLNMVILLGVVLVMSRLSDRIGRKPILATAALGLLLFSWPLFELMRTGDGLYVFLGQLGFTLLIGSYGSVNPIVLCEVFPRHVRCSAVSAAYNLSVGLAGGTAPAVATWLIETTNNPVMPAYYITACAAISVVAVLSLHESRRQALSDSVLPA
ncbi:MFS transporter [Taklimakanibacter deserti]|uniref:MFS transporter n=1 Tax=Taklimakanibacter deserti TaxID=2267839 RepID=UPI000E65D1B2